ncbi:8662_t:CDS:2 [Entrophospora sp. SA101]|nr:21737_t:CDS:2 [Entrophospora sp. SA101]CAJ0764797.1 8662_t:CDS:2 [Entrophospora sp. SA101]CAJ0824941.1 21018_t:CDS:2 [Entrophospora sp. SA101]CAJ0824963.1 21027_t:CDS:2 [Entrophospora sp. SA101]CAJ0906234.1 12423_t:CDS:2 [Entrophospora sp. SA101]
MKYIIQKYTIIRISKIEKPLELILNTPVYLQKLSDTESVFANDYKKLIKQFEKNAFLDDINDLDDDEIEVVEEENNQNIDLSSSQLDLQKTIFCRAIRMVHESQLPKSDGENYFLDRMSPNEIYLLRYSEIKHLLLEGYVELI